MGIYKDKLKYNFKKSRPQKNWFFRHLTFTVQLAKHFLCAGWYPKSNYTITWHYIVINNLINIFFVKHLKTSTEPRFAFSLNLSCSQINVCEYNVCKTSITSCDWQLQEEAFINLSVCVYLKLLVTGSQATQQYTSYF